MFSIPPMPPWDGLHPLVNHFPIALVFVLPLVLLAALVWRKAMLPLLACAALLAVVAAVGAVVATSTGEAAAEFAESVPGAKPVLQLHESLGETARNAAIGLALLLSLAAGAVWKFGERIPRKAAVIGGVACLALNAAVALIVANTAHQGGRLVHEIGVRARLSGAVAVPASSPAESPAAQPVRRGSGGQDD